MPTAHMPGRPVVILLDTHRAWLMDTEAANDVSPCWDRTFSPPPKRFCWPCFATLAVVAAAVVAAAVVAFWTLVAVGVHRWWV